jgi:hypothetical protein
MVQVYFVPGGADDLTGARGGQDGEFERAGAVAGLVAQGGHELGEFAIGKRCVVFDGFDLGAGR